MLIIDGSFGEGGGQILRTTLALSALTRKKVKVVNVRAGRPNPGLQPQHLAAVKAVAELTQAEVRGLKISSPEIEFFPQGIEGQKLEVKVGTAGSITLILQSLMPPALKAPSVVQVMLTGGTDVNWSPPLNYLISINWAVLEKFGYRGQVELFKRGYYPKGGGRIRVLLHPAQLDPINLKDRGKILGIRGISFAEDRLKKAQVAERQAQAASQVLQKKLPYLKIEVGKDYGSSLSLGSGIVLWADTEKTVLGADALGERGKRAEDVGKEAASDLIDEIESEACLDRYMADQIIPYLALAGGEATISRVTSHTATNVEVVKRFGFNLKLEGNTLTA